MDAEQRRLRGQVGAEASWANTADRSARTAPGRMAAEARFEKQARAKHPDGSDELIAKVAEHLRKAHQKRMTLAASTARSKKREATAA